MFTLTQLRQIPFYTRFFDAVHAFFWPVIWWTFNRVIRDYLASNTTEYLIGVTWWARSTSPLLATSSPTRTPTHRSPEPSVH